MGKLRIIHQYTGLCPWVLASSQPSFCGKGLEWINPMEFTHELIVVEFLFEELKQQK